MKKKNYLMALLLFLMGTAAMAQVTAVPKVSTDTEKHYYAFQNNEDVAYNVVTQDNANSPFKTSNTDPAARFTFEQALDEDGQAMEGVYYIKSARLNAYVSYGGVNKNIDVKYSATAGDTEKWVLVRKDASSETDLSFAVVTYPSKDADDRLGWNPRGGNGGTVCLWSTSPTANAASFWRMTEVEVVEPDFMAIEGLDNFRDGWYQMKTTVAYQRNVLATDKYVSCIPSGNWNFTLDGLRARPATFVYISKVGNSYHIMGPSGRYGQNNVTKAVEPANLTLETPDEDKTQVRIGGAGNHFWAGWNLSGVFIVGSSSGTNYNDESKNTKYCRFQLSHVDDFLNEHYDVYSVEVTGFSDNYNVPVDYNLAGYEGVRTAYNGGVFFIRKGTTVQASDFTVNTNVCDLTVNNDTKTISVSLRPSVMADADAVLPFIGKVGYPAEATEEVLTAYNNAVTAKSYTNMINLKTRYSAWATNANLGNIVMPVDGKAYYLRNKQQSGNGFLLYANDGTLAIKAYNDEGKDYASTFVCHRLDNGKYVFVNGQAGDYLIWKGNASRQGTTGYNNNKGFLDTYNATNCDFTLESRRTTQPGTFTLLSRRNEYPTDGDGTIVIMATGVFDAYGNSVGWSDRFSNLFILEEADYHNNVNLRMPATADEHSYASLYLPFAATVPADVEVFTATRENSWLVLNPVEGTLPAGTAVVVRGTEAGEALFVPAIEAGTAVENNVLQGTVAAEATPADTYVLSGAFEAGIGFYPYTAANLPVGKAYLTATDVPFTGESGVKGLLFGNGGTTGIGSAVTDSEAGAVYYDLSGRRVLSPAAGIYIRNGKKVFVK